MKQLTGGGCIVRQLRHWRLCWPDLRARAFFPVSKAQMDQLVANLIVAYRESIESLDWMVNKPERMR